MLRSLSLQAAAPRLGLCAVLAGLLFACTSPQKRVAVRMQELQGEWSTNLAYQANLPEQVLDWPAAVAQLRASNLKLRQTRTELTNANEAVRQVFRDLVPTLNLHGGLSKRLIDLPEVGPNDVIFSADSFFNIPGVVSFNARLYMARLYQLRAEAACALTEREQVIELYKLFWSSLEIQEQTRYVQNEKRTAQAYETVDPFSGQLLRTQTELRELSAGRESQNLQQRASDLLGSRQYRWVLSTNGLPQLRYDQEPLPLTDTNRIAQLQIRLAAIELEAARAEMAGIKLRYWPELSIFVTGPPLYQRSFGQVQFWDARELRLHADVFWWIDTRGYISRQLRQTKRQRDLQHERLRQESLAMLEKLIFTQDLIKSVREKERDLQLQLQVLEAVPPAQNYDSLQKYALDYQTTSDQLRQVQRELADLKSLFWFVDEDAWRELAPVKPLAAAQ